MIYVLLIASWAALTISAEVEQHMFAKTLRSAAGRRIIVGAGANSIILQIILTPLVSWVWGLCTLAAPIRNHVLRQMTIDTCDNKRNQLSSREQELVAQAADEYINAL